MRKIVLLTLFFLLSSFVFTGSSYGAAKEEQKPAMQWHCLESTVCSEAGANCATGPGVVAGHRAKLNIKADDLPARNKETYVFACITTEEGNICTSGDSQLDLRTVGYGGVTKLKNSSATGGFEFQGLFKSGGQASSNLKKIGIIRKVLAAVTTPANIRLTADEIGKIKANSQGKLVINDQLIEPLEWQDYTPRGVGRKWLALNLVDPVLLEMGTGGQQQGTFTFEGALSKCVAINWDPYGIVFDSQSLEPVTGVKVSLLKKRDNGQFTLVAGVDAVSIINPLYTQEDGAFSFVVPDGTYKLDLTSANFIFPNDPIKLNPSYIEVYSDIYRGEDIIQKGKIEHRDIPIDSKTTPYTSSVKVISYFPILDKGTNTFIVQGRVSHPRTKINVYGKKPSSIKTGSFVRTKLILSAQADKKGQFEIKVNLNKLDSTEMVGDIEFIKGNIINATLSIEPILNYMEGYAYDKTGNPLANATVGVYLNFSNKPAYETIANEKGFFKISSEYLPALSYGVRYLTATGVSIPTTTATFIAQNDKYIEAQKPNLYGFKDKKGQVFKAPQREPFAVVSPTGAAASSTRGAAAANWLIIGIVILLIGGVAIVAFAMFLNKKNQLPETLPPKSPEKS